MTDQTTGGIPGTEADTFTGFPAPGDKAESRRLRHSFRFCVATVILFTGMLWISEKYMRYELTESQFIAALTLEPESARAVLRQVVKRDAEERQTPTAQYLAALAAREESDLILPTYEKAYKLDPSNAPTAILYGCALIQSKRFDEARERFREAGLQPGQNALPRYLEAAALALKPESDLSESLALVAKTNSSDRQVYFPSPVWSATLPKNGYWYDKLRRQIIDECAAPLYQFSDVVIAAARKQIALRQPQYWDSWLETIQNMGKRIAFSGERSTIKATTGIQIQLAALEQREAIRRVEQLPSTDLVELRTKLEAVQTVINDFESRRSALIQKDMQCQKMPLFLALKAIALLIACTAVARLLTFVFRANPKWHALPHGHALGWLATGTTAAAGLLLLLMGVFQRMHDATVAWPERAMGILAAVWWTLLAVVLAYGLIYPRLRLAAFQPRIQDACRSVYLVFLRRYYGIVTGLYLCVLCGWSIIFRIFTGLYPWQIKLLTMGLAEQEQQVVKLALDMIQQGL